MSAITASRGMVNSAITRMLDTVRNLLYMGKWSIKRSVKPMKLWPHESNIDSTVAITRAHFTGPFTTKRLKMNNTKMSAPT